VTLDTALSPALASRLLSAATLCPSETALAPSVEARLRRVAAVPPPARRRLIVGEVVRLAPGGPSYTVVRVTPVSATLRGGHAKEVVVPDGKGGSRTFVARGSKVTTVSAFAFVERGQ